MNKTTLILLFLLFAITGNAQIQNYAFTQQSGTYQEISNGTTLGSTSSDNEYFTNLSAPQGGTSLTGPGIPIGFNFVFNGTTYDRFSVSNEGWISLGTTSKGVDMTAGVPSGSSYYWQPLSSTSAVSSEELTSKIVALTNDLSAQTGANLQYKLSGSSPNSILTIQWKNYKRKVTTATGESYNFQIKLYETSNTVQIVYGTVTSLGTVAIQVGLRAAPSTTTSNYSNRYSQTDWSNTTEIAPLANPSNKMKLSDTVFPQNGLTYAWTPINCGGVISFTASGITSGSAVINWTAGIPAPDSFEYVYSTTNTKPSGSGTPTSVTSANLSSLSSNTTYYVFMRSKCGSIYTPWNLAGSFTTLCPEETTVYENFDNSGSAQLPFCWDKAVTNGAYAFAYITTGGTAPGSAPNLLTLGTLSGSTSTDYAYAVLPPLTNLQSNNSRLRFKALTNSTTPHLQLIVGYFTNGLDTSTFTQIGDPLSLTSSQTEFVVTPGALPAGVKRLAFKMGGQTTGAIALIDDVIWEPNTSCGDISNLTASQVTNNSASLQWTKANNETKWQYVYGESTSVQNPYKLTATDVPGTSNKLDLGGLKTSTTYKVWIRSVCNTENGRWTGPVTFTTLCDPASTITETFDTYSTTTAVSAPTCWNALSGNISIISPANPQAPTPANAIRLNGTTTKAVLGLKPLTTATTATHRLKFAVRTDTPDKTLEIGYLTDAYDPTSFQKLQDVTSVSNSDYETRTYAFGSSPQSNYLAFRTDGGTFYLDNVNWEPLPCQEITGITAKLVQNTNASITWSAPNPESGWEYVKGSSSQTNPYALTTASFASVSTNGNNVTGTINGLTPNTVYNIWVRPVCTGVTDNTFFGPYKIQTSCDPVATFFQNFDQSSSEAPPCWFRAGTTGSVGTKTPINGGTAPSGSIILSLASNSTASPAIVAMPAVSNSASGTHRLSFKFRRTDANTNPVLEVGYLKNIADSGSSSFVPLKTFTASSDPNAPADVDFKPAYAELGTEPMSQVLAFRFNGAINTSIEIDDVQWAPIPTCPDVTNLKITSVSEKSISFSWAKAGSETAWQYTIAPSTVSDPNPLSPIDFSGTDTMTTGDKLPNNSPLQPSTSYKIWIRSKCSDTSFGDWIGPLQVSTTCIPVSSFTQDFNSTIPNNPPLPDCWKKVGVKGTLYLDKKDTELNDNYKLYLYTNGTDDYKPVVSMPPVTTSSMADHVLKFKFIGTILEAKLQLGYLSNASDPSSFILIKEFSAKSTRESQLEIVKLDNSPVSNILAFRNPGMVNAGGVLIDNVVWEQIPHDVPACPQQISASTDTNCGNYATTVSWTAATGADGYVLKVSETPDMANAWTKDAADQLSTSFYGKNGKTYYYRVAPYNYTGSAESCSVQSFTTISKSCYCVSMPQTIDGDGITSVLLNDSMVNIPTKTSYLDRTDKPVNVASGSKINLKTSFNTYYYSYSTAVWIDANDDQSFDESEKVSSGNSSTTSPNDLDLSFILSKSAALGKHRMRINAARKNIDSADPCYNGPYGETLDFLINIVAPVANDEPVGAKELIAGKTFEEHAIEGTNVNATGSYSVTLPDCGLYLGSDVWYKATVPTSGGITFQMNSITGGLTSAAAALYSGPIDNLQVIACDDSPSVSNDIHPRISINKRTPGETLYFRIWDKGGDDFGAFKVSAYDDPMLGLDTFSSSHFNYYPNPVKDILNISLDKEIESTTIFNLLGQTMISKNILDSKASIDMSSLPTGSYLLKISSGNDFKTLTVIKE